MTEHISARVSEDIAQMLDEPGRNKSQTVELALEQYFNADGHRQTVIDFRLSQVRDDIESLESQLQSKRKTEEYLESLKTEFEQEEQEEREQTIQNAVERFDVIELSSMDKPMVDATEEELQEYADELAMTVDELKNVIVTESDW